MQTSAATLENSMEVPQKLKRGLPYDPAIALVGIYPKDTGVLIWRGTCTPMITAALSTIAKVWKEPKCPSTDGWMKKMWCVYVSIYTYLYIYLYLYLYIDRDRDITIILSDEKEWNLAIRNNVAGTRVYDAKWTKSFKDKYHMISLICGIWDIKQMKIREGRQNNIKTERETNHMRLLNTENKLRVARGVSGEGIG